MPITAHRPDIYTGRGDRKLSQIENDLFVFLTSDRGERWDPLLISPQSAEFLSEILVEFAEDIHNDIGIWDAYEQYNREFFGTPLPLTLEPDRDTEPGAISPERVAHLVWVFAPELFPYTLVTPATPELASLSEEVSDFLNERFALVPRDSGVKKFLKAPVSRYYEVKKRLVWLGTESYLFRKVFDKYLASRLKEKVSDVEIVDDFVNTETTPWSGLGVIDILAAVLDIEPEEKAEIRTWYERHYSIYRIEKQGKDFLEATNLINNARYFIRMELKTAPFTPGKMFSGYLVPWNHEWYWSGAQHALDADDEKIRTFRNEFIDAHPEIVFRYAKDLAKKAAEIVKKQRVFFIEFYGDDLMVFPNSDAFVKSMGDFQRKYIEVNFPENKAAADEFQSSNIARPGGKLGVYYDVRDGIEVMMGFGEIEAGFKKRGVGLTRGEIQGVRSFIFDQGAGPDFVRKMAKKYGSQSVAAVFAIPNPDRHPYLEYLLRYYKGKFFRNVYPSIGFHNPELPAPSEMLTPV